MGKRRERKTRTAIERSQATNLLLQKRVDVLRKRVGSWRSADGDAAKVTTLIDDANLSISEITASCVSLSETFAKLSNAGFAPKSSSIVMLEPEARVFIKPTKLDGYAEVYSEEQLANLAVDKITEAGKVVVRIGKKGSDKVFLAPRSHLTTVSA